MLKEALTVQELIDKLLEIEDKTACVLTVNYDVEHVIYYPSVTSGERVYPSCVSLEP